MGKEQETNLGKKIELPRKQSEEVILFQASPETQPEKKKKIRLRIVKEIEITEKTFAHFPCYSLSLERLIKESFNLPSIPRRRTKEVYELFASEIEKRGLEKEIIIRKINLAPEGKKPQLAYRVARISEKEAGGLLQELWPEIEPILRKPPEAPRVERTNLIPLNNAARLFRLSKNELLWLCQKRNISLFSPGGKLREEIKKEGRYCLKASDFEVILKIPFSSSDVSHLTNTHIATLIKWANKGLIGTKPEERWVFTREDIQKIEQIKKLKEKRKREMPRRRIYDESIIGLLIDNLKKQPGTFGLREAASLIVQTGKEQGIKISENFYGTLTFWTILTLAKAVEENNPQILSPTALVFRGKLGVYCKYNLTTVDIKNILSLSSDFYQKGVNLEKNAKAAREMLSDLRKENIDLNQVAEELLGGSSYSEKRRRIEEMLFEGTLSLADYPLLFANTIGIPQEFYEKLKPVWQQQLEEIEKKRRESLSPRRRFQLEKKEGAIYALGAFFQEFFELGKRSIYTKYATFYLKKELEYLGIEKIKIEIVRASNGVSYNCYIEKNEAEKLTALRSKPKFEPIFTKTGKILQNGFQTFKEYQEYCPSDFLVSLTDGLRLLDIPIYRPAVSANIEEIKNLLVPYGIEIHETNFGLNKKTGRERKVYYLNLEDLETLVQTPNLKEEIGELLS